MKSRTATKSKTKKASGGFLETAKTIVYAVLIALVVRTVAYEPFNIPSGSMIRIVGWTSEPCAAATWTATLLAE